MSREEITAPPDATSRPERALEFPVLLASASFAFLNFSLPLRVADLDNSGIAVGALYASFTLILLLGRPLVGWALDRWGRRPFLVAAMLTYVVSMALYAMAEGLAELLIGRSVQGAAAALMWVSVRTWIADVVSPAGRGEALGRVTERSVRGSIVGATVAFALVGSLGLAIGWRLSFGLFAICALLALAIVLRRVPAAAPIARPSHTAMPPPRPEPMLLAIAASAATSAAVFPFVLLAIADRVGSQPTLVAFWMAPIAAVMGFLPSRAGRLSDRIGPVRLAPAALVLACLSAIALVFADTPLALVLALSGIVAGTAAADTALAARAAGHDEATRGRRYGHFELATGVGGVLGPLAAGFLHDHFAATGAFQFAAGTALVALLCCVLVFRSEGRA